MPNRKEGNDIKLVRKVEITLAPKVPGMALQMPVLAIIYLTNQSEEPKFKCMDANQKQPKTLQDAVIFFSDPNNALAYMIRCVGLMASSPALACGRNDVVFLQVSASGSARACMASGSFPRRLALCLRTLRFLWKSGWSSFG